MKNVMIKLKDLSNGCESEPVYLEDIIYNQSEIEFIFPNYIDKDGGEPCDASLPYKDFLFFQNNYEVIIKMKVL